MASEPVRIENYLHAADTDVDARRRCARSARSWTSRDGEIAIRGTGLREAREPDGPIDVGNAGTLLRLLPGWLAAQEGRSFTLDGDESIRRRPVDRVAEPLRLMGAELEARDGSLPAAHGARRAPARDLLRAAGRRARRSSRACCWRRSPPTAPRPSASRRAAATTPSGCCCAPASTSTATAATSPSSTPTSWCSIACACPATPARPRSWSPRACSCPGSRLLIRDVGVNWTRTGFLRIVRRMRGIVLGDLEDETRRADRAGAGQRPRRRPRRAGGDDGRARGGAAGDRRAAAGRAARLLRRGRDGRARRAGAARQGVRPHRHRRRGPARPRRRDRGDRRRLRRARHRRPARRQRSTPHGDHRLAMLGAVAGLASREGVEVRRDRGRRGLLPRLRRGPRSSRR